MNSSELKKTLEQFKTDLEGGLLSCDIWSVDSDLSLESYNANDAYTALFGRVTTNMKDALGELGFPDFGDYQITDLDMDSMILILNFEGKYMWGSLIDKSKVKLGVLIHMIVPKTRESFIKAMEM